MENLVAVTPDLSTLSSRQPNFTDEMYVPECLAISPFNLYFLVRFCLFISLLLCYDTITILICRTCRSPELKPVAEEGDPTGGSNLDSRLQIVNSCILLSLPYALFS